LEAPAVRAQPQQAVTAWNTPAKETATARPHGQGTETKANRTTYSGEWKDGKRDGQGTWV